MIPKQTTPQKTTTPKSTSLLKRILQVMVGVFVMIALTVLAVTTLPRQTAVSGSYNQQATPIPTEDPCAPYYYRDASGEWQLFYPCQEGGMNTCPEGYACSHITTFAAIDVCTNPNIWDPTCQPYTCSQAQHKADPRCAIFTCTTDPTQFFTDPCKIYTCENPKYKFDPWCTSSTPAPSGGATTPVPPIEPGYTPCTPGGFCPPVAKIGGNCIAGTVIDVYHQIGGPGWEIVVTPKDGRPAMSQITNSDGAYHFPNLAAGVYTVTIRDREGWQPYTPQSFEVTLSGAPTGCAETRFKMEALPCLIVRKVDQGGNQGFADLVGLPDWDITVKSGTYSETQTTDALGIAVFPNLQPGIWTIQEEPKTGWTSATGITPVITLISPREPYKCDSLDLINQQVHDSCIKVRKLDENNLPIPNWGISLTRNDGTREPISKTTNNDGYVQFDSLQLGAWTLTEEIKPGWHPIGETSMVVNLDEPSLTCKEITFKNQRTTCVEGYKINHFEQGLSNWQITATNATTGEAFTILTNELGYFKFDDLVPGTWTFTEEMQPGWEPVTSPSMTLNLTVDPSNPEKCEQIRFKNRTDYACVDVYKYDNTLAPLPGWQMTLQPAYGGTPVVGYTDGTGWIRFNMLPPGEYQVTETMQPGWDPDGPTTQYITVEATGTCGIIQFYNRQEPPYGSTLPAPTPIVVDQPGNNDGGSPANPTCSATYTVRSGDTLYAIAATYSTTITALQAANNIYGSLIFPGQVLCIP